MKHHYVYEKHSFKFLNATQFLGALNDNVFKLLIIYLLINVQGVSRAPIILSLAGAIFVIPFLLFSSAAGVLADRISKRSILVTMKFAEIIIMALSLIAIYFKSGPALYGLLFL
ncbi:MFS transporter, partial [Patescibacteria group bacterium]|nr:MFS transporter [Patescibacteria group bacterium]